MDVMRVDLDAAVFLHRDQQRVAGETSIEKICIPGAEGELFREFIQLAVQQCGLHLSKTVVQSEERAGRFYSQDGADIVVQLLVVCCYDSGFPACKVFRILT